MFTLLDGEIELTFRGEKRLVKAGTVNVPANAPHVLHERLRQDIAAALHVRDQFRGFGQSLGRAFSEAINAIGKVGVRRNGEGCPWAP
jgi:hypothetical protein